MPLPVDKKKLIRGRSIESERIEYKKGWNPEDILHTMCAFANDIHNWGGGYIIVGVEEVDGQPQLPPVGVKRGEIDSNLKDLNRLVHKMSPSYAPIADTYEYEGKMVLILWCPAGDNRPYKAAISCSRKKSEQTHYIRIGTSTVKASPDQVNLLYELAARIPFDDRINHQATIDDLDRGLIQDFLKEVDSDLAYAAPGMSTAELALTMLIAKKYGEEVRPLNVGLLFFSNKPEKYFPRARIEVVIHPDYSAKQFDEKIFSGPIHHQLRNALSYSKTLIIRERVTKDPERAEADRYYNYPFSALEEALANAVYHRSYEVQEPTEVQIWPDKIDILSFPGPVPPVTKETLLNLPKQEKKQLIARAYRNRRVGDFLKELHLTEARGTGFPTIYGALARNGSPEPHFETDDNLTYFLATIYCREDMVVVDEAGSEDKENSSYNKAGSFQDKAGSFQDKAGSFQDKAGSFQDYDPSFQDKEQDMKSQIREELRDDLAGIGGRTPRQRMKLVILKICRGRYVPLSIIAKLTQRSETYLGQDYVKPLVERGLLEYEYREVTNPNQRYRTTEAGLRFIEESERGATE